MIEELIIQAIARQLSVEDAAQLLARLLSEPAEAAQ